MNSQLNALSRQLWNQTKFVLMPMLVLVPSICMAQIGTPRTAPPPQSQKCTGTYAGVWTSPQIGNARMVLIVSGNLVQGTYEFGQQQRKLSGKIDDGELTGNWGGNGRNGTFSASISSDQRLHISFFIGANQIDSQIWTCQPRTPTPSGGGGGTTPPPPQTPLEPGRSENHDYDNFRTFDALPKAEQAKTLRKHGPRLPHEYKAYAFSMRVFLAAGWPMAVDYSLDSDKDAQLKLEVDGGASTIVSLPPSPRNQIRVIVPSEFPQTSTVGKIEIAAFNSNSRPAPFRLNGIAIGSRGVQALRQHFVQYDYALNRTKENAEAENSPLRVTLPPDLFSSIDVSVQDPTTIKPGVKPKQKIKFSLVSQALFSNGRWELWHSDGLDWKQVWQEKTGNIEPNRVKTNAWDGIISVRRIVSVGDHSLQVLAWLGDEGDNSWVIARAQPVLTVIQ